MWETIIPAASVVIVAVIEAISAFSATKRRKASEAERMKREEQEKAREEMMVLLVKSSRSAISLGAAVAHALQRGHTNGDCEAALEYAEQIKQEQKEKLTQLGVHAMWD